MPKNGSGLLKYAEMKHPQFNIKGCLVSAYFNKPNQKLYDLMTFKGLTEPCRSEEICLYLLGY